MRDFMLDEDNDFLLVNGDIKVGFSDLQHQKKLLESAPGDWNQSPKVGVALFGYLEDEDPDEMLQNIRDQFRMDGCPVKKINIKNGKMNIEAIYK